MPKQKIENGKSIKYRVKVESLHWHNLISSIMNAAYPRNLFTDVPNGEYSLIAKLSARSPDWKPEDQKYIAFESNSVTVEVKTRGK
jgi:hypothetical protein